MKIKVNNNIKDIGTTIAYSADDAYVGIVKNYYALLDLRNQIKENKLKGYYLKYWTNDDVDTNNFIIIKIDSTGECSDYPNNFFDTSLVLLNKLFDI